MEDAAREIYFRFFSRYAVFLSFPAARVLTYMHVIRGIKGYRNVSKRGGGFLRETAKGKKKKKLRKLLSPTLRT